MCLETWSRKENSRYLEVLQCFWSDLPGIKNYFQSTIKLYSVQTDSFEISTERQTVKLFG
jgi:hypothetical protein